MLCSLFEGSCIQTEEVIMNTLDLLSGSQLPVYFVVAIGSTNLWSFQTNLFAIIAADTGQTEENSEDF